MKRMLFNAAHAEELRVATVDGQKLIDFDIEVAGREQKKSNIYKGVVTRVEQSLEACFVNYGEERHGFLPFKEISIEFQQNNLPTSSNSKNKTPIIEGAELLVQVEKEERGNKGAALTTFISLAGRYLVLMPNNPKGGGVSRRVEGEERQELKDAIEKLDLSNGMSVIARTAGIGRSVDELQWDLTYLTQLWNAISGARSLQQGAYLIYQESSLVIRAIRDYFHPEIGEILIDTDDIYEQAKQFMQHVMPDMESRVKKYSEDFPLYSRFQIEHQIETAYSRVVQLPLGGAIVIDHTEALVAVDVNSARSTKGSDIEDTAFKTNLEAAEEIGRQLRLRDLGGLIVIDFIDMESSKNQRDIEQRLKDSLSIDRARVQMGKISRFGLVELSRQRLRPALNEGSHVTCARCNGVGVVRDVNSSALHVLRVIQEESMKDGTSSIYVQVPLEVATFLLNEKRTDLATLEVQLKVTVVLIPNKFLETPNYKIERLKFEDPRLDDAKPSYKISEPPSSDLNYLSTKELKKTKTNQKAVIKGIAPNVPAPTAKSKASSKGILKSLYKNILGLFKENKKPKRNKNPLKTKQANRKRNNISNRKQNSFQSRVKDRNTLKNSANLRKVQPAQRNKFTKEIDTTKKNPLSQVKPLTRVSENNQTKGKNDFIKSKEDEISKVNLNEDKPLDRSKKRKRKPIRKLETTPNVVETKPKSTNTDDQADKKVIADKIDDQIASPTISPEYANHKTIDLDKENIKKSKNSIEHNKKTLQELESDIKSTGLEWIQTKQKKEDFTVEKIIQNANLGRKISRKKLPGNEKVSLEMVETKKKNL